MIQKNKNNPSRRKYNKNLCEDIVEVSVSTDSQVRLKVIPLLEGELLSVKSAQVVDVDGNLEYVVERREGVLTTLSYDERGAIYYRSRTVSNNRIHRLNHFSSVSVHYPHDRYFPQYRNILYNAGIEPPKTV